MKFEVGPFAVIQELLPKCKDQQLKKKAKQLLDEYTKWHQRRNNIQDKTLRRKMFDAFERQGKGMARQLEDLIEGQPAYGEQ